MRHFTPDEANAALAEVRPLVERMVAHRRAHTEALERQEELEGRIRGNGGGIPATLMGLDRQMRGRGVSDATTMATAMSPTVTSTLSICVPTHSSVGSLTHL